MSFNLCYSQINFNVNNIIIEDIEGNYFNSDVDLNVLFFDNFILIDTLIIHLTFKYSINNDKERINIYLSKDNSYYNVYFSENEIYKIVNKHKNYLIIYNKKIKKI